MIALLLLLQTDVEIRKELTQRALALERDFAIDDLEKRRPKLREEYFHMLGLWPLPEKSPLKATVTGTLEFPGFVVEKLHYQSKPGLYVTANLYRPAAPGKYPAILYSIGHYRAPRDGHKAAVQDHGIWFATHGYVALLVDTIELGEVTCTHHGTYSDKRWWWHSAGFTPAGVECWNAIRGIDYLQSRPDVDPERIGATGISGGGAATFWISAADERVKASAPVSGMADLTWYIGEDGVNGHCDCMFLYNTFRWNWTSIAALVAPRPMLFTNSDDDKIFPMSANERVINRLERLYSKFGASDKVDAMVSVGGHAYRTDLRRSVFEFFNRTLKNDASPVTDADAGLGANGKASRIPSRDLRVFPEDKDIPADQLNTKIDEVFVPLGKPGLPEEGKFEAWRDPLLAELKRVCFGGDIERRAPGFVRNPVIVTEDAAVPDWAAPYMEPGAGVYRLKGGWTIKNPPNTVEREFALLGWSADAERARDLASMLAAAPTVVGRGRSGIIGAYASLLFGRGEVVVIDPPASHREGPHFINVLRVLDIPEALGMLAPRKLTLINAKDPAFDRTVEIYRRAGAADKIDRR
ncbi:MAG TPA: prolyl oligopeptidase family serine peptidase [Planctomycetota bacterium]